MSALTATEIRNRFLVFFAAHDHRVVRSSSLVPANDPTLLFTNAGMVQFKDVFTGRETRDYQRATSTQKCVRAGGKHNDLENVGVTARHHTFFEMLGNFSFGDYFKEDAIRWSWDFLVGELGLDVDRLTVTVFRDDDEAAEIWERQIRVPRERILRLGEKDNFWQMGDTGPCGPCSEVHYFQGDHLPCSEPTCLGVECECDRHLEVWNLVFMQFDRSADGTLTPLPKPSIDTGMGLERVAAVVAGKDSNYEVDLLRDVIAEVEAASGKTYGGGMSEDDISMRVIADHARATTFLVADGVMPSNEGRGYVLRRIMRRGIRHGKRLGFEEVFLSRICERVVSVMSEAFPELAEQKAFILEVATREEKSFRRTLDRGLRILEQKLEELGDAKELAGADAFLLYDTYGFPLDLTQVILRERGLTVDEIGFQKALDDQKAGSGGKLGAGEAVDDLFLSWAERYGETDFLGYEAEAGEGRVLAMAREGQEVAEASAGQTVELILDRSPFYAESGGQVGDEGTLTAEGFAAKVSQTHKPAGLHVHVCEITEGSLKVEQKVVASVDGERRRKIRANHSATHLLHLALQETLGDHAKQKGSLVAPDLLRFDYAHFEPLSEEETEAIERRVNRLVALNAPSVTEVLGFEEARGKGAMAIFGEKYGDSVRTVRIGEESLELCGGTHVERAGDIGFFKIVSDASIASGIRRIVAVTGEAAVERVLEEERTLRRAGEALKAAPRELAARAEAAVARVKELEREVHRLEQKLATASSSDLLDNLREVHGVKVLATKVEVKEAKGLRELADKLRDRLGSGVVALGAENDGKATLLVAVTKDLTGRLRAGDLVREIAPLVDGRGGGKPDLAQAGGTRPEAIEQALARVYDLIPEA
ncbi:MAG: alanine--tRNA ligase [Deltaproteobacteria bacterium]|nr:alanine--tRNA ligase [Deltaproteobacteria bacterium]